MADPEFIDVSATMAQDGRGFSFFPWRDRAADPNEVVRTVHLVSIQPGRSRGHHYHPGHEEWLFTFHGAGVLAWESGGRIRERTISGNGTLICIPPGVPHALTNPGPELLYLLAWRQPAGSGPAEPESVSQKLRVA